MRPAPAGQVSNNRRRASSVVLLARAGLLTLLVLSMLGAGTGAALAGSPTENRAGLVVRFGDGQVQTACLDLGASGQATGEELLRLAGLQPVMEYSALGGIVCQIGAEGCGFPEQSCWCQCKGDPCVYWRYYHQVEDQWVYAVLGASSYVVRAGEVDGWAWGGSDEVLPPLLTLDQICAEPVAAPAGAALHTPAPPDLIATTAEANPSMLSSAGLQASVALAASEASATIPAAGAGDYALFGGIFLMVVVGAAGLRLAGAGRAAAPIKKRRSPAIALPELSVYGLSLAIGVVALLYPFLVTAVQPTAAGTARAGESPLLLFVLMGLCFAALLVEVQGQAVSAKQIALLGVLVAINAVLRFIEVGIPGPGGFSPIFVLIVLTGYVYGGRFGFLLGALTMLVSGLITGGVGPWLPGQMFTAGWVGLSAPLLRPLVRALGGAEGSRRELVVVALFGAAWGFLYGLIINLWFWPFMAGPAGQYYQAGLGLADVARRYAAFYLATSLLWDSMAMLGNGLLLLAFGQPALRALRRFQQRFDFEYLPAR